MVSGSSSVQSPPAVLPLPVLAGVAVLAAVVPASSVAAVEAPGAESVDAVPAASSSSSPHAATTSPAAISTIAHPLLFVMRPP